MYIIAFIARTKMRNRRILLYKSRLRGKTSRIKAQNARHIVNTAKNTETWNFNRNSD